MMMKAIFGRWLVGGLLGAALTVLPWGGPPSAQVSEPSAFSETYGKWTVRCAVGGTQDGGEGVRQCVMEQRFIWQDKEAGQSRPLLTVTLAPAGADAGMEAVVIAPFGLLFEPGLRLRADQLQGTRLAFQTCLPEGCIARGALDDVMMESFRAGVVLHVEAEPAAGGDAFRLEGSLSGFSDAHRRLLQEVEGR